MKVVTERTSKKYKLIYLMCIASIMGSCAVPAAFDQVKNTEPFATIVALLFCAMFFGGWFGLVATKFTVWWNHG